MMMSKWKKWLIGLLVVAAVVALITVLTRTDNNFEKKYAGYDLSEDVEGFSRADTSYDSYLLKYDDALAVTGLTDANRESASAWHDIYGDLYVVPAGNTAEWEITVAIEGDYGIEVEYTTPVEYTGAPVMALMLGEAELFNGSAAFVMPEIDTAIGTFEVEEGLTPEVVTEVVIVDENAAEETTEAAEEEVIPVVTKTLHNKQKVMLADAEGNEIKAHLVPGTYKLTVKCDDTDVVYEMIELRSKADRPAGKNYTVDMDDFTVEAGTAYTATTDDAEKDLKSYTHTSGLCTEADSVVTLKVNVEEAGYYYVLLDYYAVASRGVDIERIISINGEVPFDGAKTLCFSRMWTDKSKVRVINDGKVVFDGEGEAEVITVNGNAGVRVTKDKAILFEGEGTFETYTVKKDNQGNDIRPSQAEYFGWQQAYCRDDMGYETLPYQFYFVKGENTITLQAVNEPMIIGAITVTSVTSRATYEQYKAAAPEQVTMTAEGENYLQIVQGESAYLRSTPSLFPKYDRSSAATVPYSVDKTILNYIGGDSWNKPNEWIEWQFEVPEDGYYNITVKARQHYQRGALSCRSVYIDGVIPFEELSAVEFMYSTEWQMYTLGDKEGNAYRFYLTKGNHTIRLEATLGAMGEILKNMEDSIFRLNLIYRKILVLTGVNPDRFRDYDLKGKYPEVIDAMALEGRRLYKLVDDTVSITGQKSDRVAVAQTIAVQLEQFVKNNQRITESFTNFKDNITSLGTAMQNMSETKLDIDLVVISGEKAALPTYNDGFFAQMGHEIRSCVTSFFVDYNSLGDKYDEENDDNLIEVWITTGRDQSTILKTMIDDDFTPNYLTADGKQIHVNVKLVVADTLLTAVVAGNGPDVVLSLGSWFPVNYAMRNAVEDLTQFPDYNEVVSDFEPSALVAMTYRSYEKDADGEVVKDENGELKYHDGVYALPETQEYSLLFYRTDVLSEYDLKVPETWDELIAILPTLQGNNLSVGIPYPDIVVVDMSVLNSMIYQNDGAIYDEHGMKTEIDNESGVAAFKTYTSLYNDYGLPTVYDFVSRFRSGEMPIGISSYSAYNTLAVSAPEIRGLWDFALLPGTRKTGADGKEFIDRSVHAQGLTCMLIATDNETIKQNAWTFMKWWVSAETQVRFGREIESVLGSSARYATANKQALKQLAWTNDQLKVLQEQQSWTVGFREVAGGYSTTRHMTNAIRKVINDKDDVRETVMNYAKTINEEIKIKRQEFNLPTE